MRRDWTGPALAERLEVTTRTVRNDIDRLRRLGYPVEASPGVAGGYRLGESVTMPPMLLDEEEAVAVAIALRTATSASVEGLGEASIRALVKLQRLLPSRLRERVESLRVAALPLAADGGHIDPELLVTIAGACRNGDWVRFSYEAHSGSTSDRDVEPYRLLARDGRWYLFAWDREREDWRTFRVDRIRLRTPIGPRFPPRPCHPTKRSQPTSRRGSIAAPGASGRASWCTPRRSTCGSASRSARDHRARAGSERARRRIG